MKSLRISAVSYLNTFPFVFGIKESGLLKNYELRLEVPSKCAASFIEGKADIALVPVGSLPVVGEYHYLSDYCIGAVNEVRTVLLLSKVPLDLIRRVHLDPDSGTSVKLVKVLARNHWRIDPEWVSVNADAIGPAGDMESLVAIGDKTFALRRHFPYVYDLASEWISFTGLPFVFAVWISREPQDDSIVRSFSGALEFGISHIGECIEYFRDRLPAGEDSRAYLEKSISFAFDNRKQAGLDLFLRYLRP